MFRRLLRRWGNGGLDESANDKPPALLGFIADAPDPIALVRVISSSNGAVVADPASDELKHTPGDKAGDGTKIVGLVVPAPYGDRDLLFVCSLDGTRPIRPEAAIESAPVLVYELDPAGHDGGAWGLRDPQTRLLLSAANAGTATIPCNRQTIDGWERFRLEPVADVPVPAPLAAIDRLLRDRPTAQDLLAWLRGGPQSSLAACGPAVLRILPEGLLETVAADIAVDRSLLHHLADAGGGWFGEALRALSAWQNDRRVQSRLTVDERFDALGRPPDLHAGVTLLARLRAQVEPRRTLSVLAIARNDGIHLLDWIAHHRALGVEHFFIYLGASVDGSAELLAALADAGIVTLVDERHAPGIDSHRKMCNHALSCLPQTLDYRWTMLIEIDEYVVLDTARHRDLPALLAARAGEGAQAVALFRLFFRPGPQVDWSPEPVVARFRHRYSQAFPHLRTVFVTGEHVSSNSHHPQARPGAAIVTCDATGRRQRWPGSQGSATEGRPVFEDAWINVYAIKSIEEYLWRRAGATASLPHDLSPSAVFGHIRSVVEEDVVLDERACAHLPAQQEELTALRALPGVEHAERLVVDNFRHQSWALARLVESSMQRDPILRGVAAAWLPGDRTKSPVS